MRDELESKVLSYLMNEPKNINKAISLKITKESFIKTNHQFLFSAIQTLYNSNKQINIITLSDEFAKQSNVAELDAQIVCAKLLGDYDYTVDYLTLFLKLKDYELNNKIKDFARGVLSEAEKNKSSVDLLGYVNKSIKPINDNLPSKEKKSFLDISKQATKDVQELTLPDNGVDMGITEVRRNRGKFRKGELVIVAARPGMGKTLFALKASVTGKKTMFFSMEMLDSQLLNRLTVMLSKGLKMNDVFTTGIHSDEKWNDYTLTQQRIGNIPLDIYDKGGISVDEVCNVCRNTQDLEMIIIDYLGLMKGHIGVSYGTNKNRELEDITGALKQLALELKVPVILLSQLSRAVEARTNKRPLLSDLRDSGAIEQDADRVIFLYRPYYYTNDEMELNDIEIITAKHRNGNIGIDKAYFDGARAYIGDNPIPDDSSFAIIPDEEPEF